MRDTGYQKNQYEGFLIKKSDELKNQENQLIRYINILDDIFNLISSTEEGHNFLNNFAITNNETGITFKIKTIIDEYKDNWIIKKYKKRFGILFEIDHISTPDEVEFFFVNLFKQYISLHPYDLTLEKYNILFNKLHNYIHIISGQEPESI